MKGQKMPPRKSLNPLAPEFIPSKSDRPWKQVNPMTPSTTLLQQEAAGDSTNLADERQLIKLLQEVGNNIVPVKAMKFMLSPDGQSINVLFKTASCRKHIMDENAGQNADKTVQSEMTDRCSISPSALPNELVANFMARMRDLLNIGSTQKENTEYVENKSSNSADEQFKSEPLPRSGSKRQPESDTIDIKDEIPESGNKSHVDGIPENNKKSNLPQLLRKSPKIAPRETHSSSIRQSEAQKRLHQLKITTKKK